MLTLQQRISSIGKINNKELERQVRHCFWSSSVVYVAVVAHCFVLDPAYRPCT